MTGETEVVDIDQAKPGDVVRWHGKLHRVNVCPLAGERCFACERLGRHLDPIDLEKNDLKSALERYWDAEDESPTPLVKALGAYMRRLVGDELMTYGLLRHESFDRGTGRMACVPVRSSEAQKAPEVAVIRVPGTPLWLERWRPEGKCVIAVYESDGMAGYGYRAECEVTTVRELIAGLPLYIQALLDIEGDLDGSRYACCGWAPIEGHRPASENRRQCSVDAALNAADLKTVGSRREARQLLAAFRKEGRA